MATATHKSFIDTARRVFKGFACGKSRSKCAAASQSESSILSVMLLHEFAAPLIARVHAECSMDRGKHRTLLALSLFCSASAAGHYCSFAR